MPMLKLESLLLAQARRRWNFVGTYWVCAEALPRIRIMSNDATYLMHMIC